MEQELDEVKKQMRALAVSSTAPWLDLRTLLQDYEEIIGVPLPFARFGFRYPVGFLRELCGDCFLGPVYNPRLTLIVPDVLEHLVQRPARPENEKKKRPIAPDCDVCANNEDCFNFMHSLMSAPRVGPGTSTGTSTGGARRRDQREYPTRSHRARASGPAQEPAAARWVQPRAGASAGPSGVQPRAEASAGPRFAPRFAPHGTARGLFRGAARGFPRNTYRGEDFPPGAYRGEDATPGPSTSQPSSSRSDTEEEAEQMEELKERLRDLVLGRYNGIQITVLITLYCQRYGIDEPFVHLDGADLLRLMSELPGVGVMRRDGSGDCVLYDEELGPPRAEPPAPSPPPRGPSPPPPRKPARLPIPDLHVLDDPDDALPGIDYAPEVFPEDCLHMLESIPAASVEGIRPGDRLEVEVGEIYSPGNFWLYRLGEQYHVPLGEIMREMNEYYTRGEGRDRQLLPGAVRVGYHCACLYQRSWNRARIDRVIDENTVQVLYVDYGTVARVPVDGLRYLRVEWAAHQAQALRARLAGVRPPAALRQWPVDAGRHFHDLVLDHSLIADVAAVDEFGVLEVTLVNVVVDTSTGEGEVLCVGRELVRAGYAAPQGSALRPARARPGPHGSDLDSDDLSEPE